MKKNLFKDLCICNSEFSRRIGTSKTTVYFFAHGKKVSADTILKIYDQLKYIEKEISKLSVESLIKLSNINRRQKEKKKPQNEKSNKKGN